VPKAVRQALGLKPGDKVVFEQEGEEICVRPVRAQSMFARYEVSETQGWLPAERLCCERFASSEVMTPNTNDYRSRYKRADGALGSGRRLEFNRTSGLGRGVCAR
jgi:AbrB family looped-hinge helix DNA binding protein